MKAESKAAYKQTQNLKNQLPELNKFWQALG
jgi:hypothetical protein